MSALKPLRKPAARSARRRSTRRSAPPRSSASLVGVALIVIALALVAVLIGRARAAGPEAASSIPVEQAVRPLNAPTGQTADGYWYKGNPDAPVTVMVFGDFQCPSCQATYQQIEGQLDQQYVETGKIKFVFHDFPLPMHANAIPAAQAARAAGAQGQFWAMHDLLYARQAEWEDDTSITTRLKGYAADLGLDPQAFDKALDEGQYAQAINAAIAAGRNQGINSTPTYLVDGKVVQTSALIAAIDQALQAKGR
jgi:protein-disulfide isomerase